MRMVYALPRRHALALQGLRPDASLRRTPGRRRTALRHGRQDSGQEFLRARRRRGDARAVGARPVSWGLRAQDQTQLCAAPEGCGLNRMGWASHYIAKLKNGEAVSFRPRGLD